jgi:hypothetical protein
MTAVCALPVCMRDDLFSWLFAARDITMALAIVLPCSFTLAPIERLISQIWVYFLLISFLSTVLAVIV